MLLLPLAACLATCKMPVLLLRASKSSSCAALRGRRRGADELVNPGRFRVWVDDVNVVAFGGEPVHFVDVVPAARGRQRRLLTLASRRSRRRPVPFGPLAGRDQALGTAALEDVAS